jgi:hypothetical protein
VCDRLDARGGLGAFAHAAAPTASIGGVTLEAALSEARRAVAESGAAEAGGGGGGSGSSSEGQWQWGGEAERIAAGVMRSLAFERAFGGIGGGGGGACLGGGLREAEGDGADGAAATVAGAE